MHELMLCLIGLCAGLMGGFLGIGGGVLLVPLLIFMGHDYVRAVATSSLGVLIIAFSGTLRNLSRRSVLLSDISLMGSAAVVTAYLGAMAVPLVHESIAKVLFASMLFCMPIVQKIKSRASNLETVDTNRFLPRPFIYLLAGAAGGILAGFFGVGGGIILVPMQVLLLKVPLKQAVPTSLGVIVFAAGSACIRYGLENHIDFTAGGFLGLGGFLGVLISSSYLPKVEERYIRRAFNALVLSIAAYFLYRAYLAL
ncbi:MAG: sulfite exporter TauE/SafE family protein [Oligoflexales bacterium]|nr:sulfite exporter TauE/SafE family protein [Oligoflexales bacterium]